jgi:SlyX protein
VVLYWGFKIFNAYFTFLGNIMSEERLVGLEIKLAYQEDLLQTLNSIVTEQQKQIGRLEETCKILYERLKSLSFAEELDQTDNQPPPHY